MVRDRTTDGERLAELLASEVHGRGSGPLGRLCIVDAVEGVEPDPDGAFAYAIARDDRTSDDDRIAAVYIQPDRVRIDVERGVETAADAGREAGLRVRPKAVHPPQTLLFVEDGAEVKRATDALAAVVRSLSSDDGS